MKKVLRYGLALITIISTCFLASCDLPEHLDEDPTASAEVFEKLQKDGYQGTQEDLLNTLKNETKKDSDTWTNKESAYDIAIDNGYNGSKADWLDALIGSKEYEKDYSDGKTVYELAVLNGFKGTLKDWLETLEKPLTEVTTEALETTTEKEPNVESKEFFTVTFKNYNGELIKIDKVKKGESATPPPTPKRDGYTFVGWDRTFNKIEFDTIINAQFKKIKEPTIIVGRTDSFAGAKNVEVIVAIMKNPGISSLGLNISYSPHLTLKDMKYNKDIKGESMKPGTLETPTKLTWLSPFEDVDGDWTLATLYFDISEKAVGDLPISVTYNTDNIYNMEEENIYFDVIDGAIAIIK